MLAEYISLEVIISWLKRKKQKIYAFMMFKKKCDYTDIVVVCGGADVHNKAIAQLYGGNGKE